MDLAERDRQEDQPFLGPPTDGETICLDDVPDEVFVGETYPRYFKHSRGEFAAGRDRTYVIRCDGPHAAKFVFSDGESEAGDWPPMSVCLEQVAEGCWVEFKPEPARVAT